MKMQNAELEFVAFDAQDVMTTSGPSYDKYVTFANFGDGDPDNNAIALGGGEALSDMNNSGELQQALAYYIEDSITMGTTFGSLSLSDYDLANRDDLSSDWNGKWSWISSHRHVNTKTKKQGKGNFS